MPRSITQTTVYCTIFLYDIMGKAKPWGQKTDSWLPSGGGGRWLDTKEKEGTFPSHKMFYRLKRKLLLGLGWWCEKGQKTLQESLFWAEHTVLLSRETGLSTWALVWANSTGFISTLFRISMRSWQTQDSEEGREYPGSGALILQHLRMASSGLKYGSPQEESLAVFYRGCYMFNFNVFILGCYLRS